MSLLLDALRRASARRDDPLADRLDVGRHAPAADKGAAAAPPAADADHDAESSAPPSGSARSEDELTLVPEADERPAPEPRSGEVAQPAETTGGSQAQSGQRERAAAAALLHAGSGRRRASGSRLLGLTLAVLVVSAALGGGGWLWHMQSQEDIDTALGGYRPEPAQAEFAANAAAESGPTAQSQTVSNPAQGAQSTQTASDSSADSPGESSPADSSAESSPADSGSENAAPATSSAAQDAGESDAEGDGATATVEATDNRPPAEPEEQLAQAAAQLAGGAPAPNGAAEAEPASVQGNTASDVDAASRGDAADAGGGSGSSSEGRARDLVEASGQAGGQRQSPAPRSAAAQPPRPMIKQADDAPLVDALNTGYRALGAGDLAAAEQSYARARRLAPDNRDALLGAAAVRQRQGNIDAAHRLYLQVLDAYPRDPHAQAALAALDAGATRRNETTLKMLLRDNPNAAALHYALGNVYATESRWSEARMAYARAAQVAPQDPDYAYNLAVALDHLGRRDAARRTYAQALSLASGAAADFDPAAVRRRLQQLR